MCFKGSKPILGTGKYPDDFQGQLSPLVNQMVFFIMWSMGMAWAIFNFFYGGGMPNHFRTHCSFAEATHVLCLQKTEKIVMSNPSWWVRTSRSIGSMLSSDEVWFRATAEVDAVGTPTFVFMCAQYILQGATFVKASVEVDNDYAALRAMKGITATEAAQRIATVGTNEIPFDVESYLVLLGKELCTYLYMYQFTFFMVWIWFGGLVWCSPQMVIVIVLACMSISISKKNQLKIQEISESGMKDDQGNDRTVNVFRGGVKTAIKATQVVPGDCIELSDTMTLPCDLIVINGTCICDESGLTGESMPVRKSEVPTTAGSYDADKDKKHTLYAGTDLLQATSADGPATAIVKNTGIRTEKGDLVSMILYPATMVFEYDEELRVVFSLLSVYATFLFFISVWLQVKISPLTWVSVFAFACFTISQILPPLLAIALVVGHTKSANRLSDKKVLCVQPKRIAISGKIHAFMFDKTGTLTKQGLDFIGVHQCNNAKWAIAEADATKDSSVTKWTGEGSAEMKMALGTAHAVSYLGEKIVGNQVEVQMFNGSGWTLGKDGMTVTKGAESLIIVKRFEFDHHSMTMSVIVKDAAGDCHVFCKGAPEAISSLCDESSLPGGKTACDTVALKHADQGCYVIGMSHNNLGKKSDGEIAKITRGEVEKKGSLTMIGQLLFRNELKVDTAKAISMIKDGDVRPVMVTGDNAHCGYYIAKQCNIVEADVTIYWTVVDKAGNVTWENMASPEDENISTEQVKAECAKGGVELAITGAAMKLFGPVIIDELLLDTRIFARVKPDQKVQVIDQYIDRGFITGMCGDGGNDCGALRKAHAGIALSEAEASVVSPFTSAPVTVYDDAGVAQEEKAMSVMSCVYVLCEGRCALVTSFSAYRFYITYGLNWSIVKTINFVYGVRMPIIAYLTIDSICSWLCAGAITGALPLETLQKYRPTSSLFSPQIFQSVIVPWCVWMTLMTIFLKFEGDHEDHVDMQPQLSGGVGYWELGDTWESTVFTYFQVCPLIWCGVCYSNGSKFRQSLWSNWQILTVWGSIFLVYFLVLILEPSDFTAFFHVASNAHNGFNTASPVWMRYQFPRGCSAGPTIPGDTKMSATIAFAAKEATYVASGGTAGECSPYFAAAAGKDCDGNVYAGTPVTCCPSPEWYNVETGFGILNTTTNTRSGGWRGSLPDNCDLVNIKVGNCGVRCTGTSEKCSLKNNFKASTVAKPTDNVEDVHALCTAVTLGTDDTEDMCEKIDGCLYTAFRPRQEAGMPTPGMKTSMRWVLCLCIFCGMFFMMTWEHYLNYKYAHIVADWETEAKGAQAATKVEDIARP